MTVAIVTDSVVSVPETILKELLIHSVPYYIHRGEETLRDLVTIDRETFYKWLPQADEIPTTACPGVGDYASTYENILDMEGTEEIISIHMTSKGSGAYQSAVSARGIIMEKFPEIKIEVVDTLNVSMCHGWMVIEAARAALEGKSMPDILNIVTNLIPIAKMVQTADTLKYLYMGGRIGKAKHLIGSLLNIKPLISMENGTIVAVGQVRSRRRAYDRMCEYIENRVASSGKIKIAYVHAAALEEAEKIKSIIENRFDCVESIIAELSPALGVHTGPGTAGICFYPIID